MGTTSDNDKASAAKSKGAACLFLLLLSVFVAYSNTLRVSWHLDDITNIVENKNVHVTRLSLREMARSVRYPSLTSASHWLNRRNLAKISSRAGDCAGRSSSLRTS